MKIVSISQDFFDLVEGDRELMLKHNRPCIVVVRLRFRGKRRDFAVPLRSNIAPNVPKDQYEREGRPRFAVDIDRIVSLLEGEK